MKTSKESTPDSFQAARELFFSTLKDFETKYKTWEQFAKEIELNTLTYGSMFVSGGGELPSELEDAFHRAHDEIKILLEPLPLTIAYAQHSSLLALKLASIASTSFNIGSKSASQLVSPRLLEKTTLSILLSKKNEELQEQVRGLKDLQAQMKHAPNKKYPDKVFQQFQRESLKLKQPAAYDKIAQKYGYPPEKLESFLRAYRRWNRNQPTSRT